MYQVSPELMKLLISVLKDVNGPRKIPSHWCDSRMEWGRVMNDLYDVVLAATPGQEVVCPACNGNCIFCIRPNKDHPDGSYTWSEYEDCDFCSGEGKVIAGIPLDNTQSPDYQG